GSGSRRGRANRKTSKNEGHEQQAVFGSPSENVEQRDGARSRIGAGKEGRNMPTGRARPRREGERGAGRQ
ncbi:hypothetical protein KI387_022127, partial [Taxus chinensis]